MRKILSSFIFIGLFSSLNGQIQKGNVSLNGSFNFSTFSSESSSNYSIGNSKEYAFRFNPVAQKFIQDDLSVGLGLTLSTQNNDTKTIYLNSINLPSTSTSNNSSIGIGFHASKYYDLSEKLYFTLNGTLGIEHGITKISASYRSNSIGLILGPGFDYLLNQSFALSSSISVLQLVRTRAVDNELNYENTISNFSINLNQTSFFIGVKYFFTPKNMNINPKPVTN